MNDNYRGIDNPFAYKVNDEKMIADNAVNYIPPEKRKLMKEYLSKSSFRHPANIGK